MCRTRRELFEYLNAAAFPKPPSPDAEEQVGLGEGGTLEVKNGQDAQQVLICAY